MLNDSRIRYFIQQSDLITPYDESLLQPHSIDLRLGTNFKIPVRPTTDKSFVAGPKWIHNEVTYTEMVNHYEYNEHKGEFHDVDIETDGSFMLPSLSFVLAHTIEIVKVPQNLVGFCCGKSTIARNGLQIEAAGLLDAGFHGQVTLELFNMSPWSLNLKAGLPICQVYFCNADEPMHKFYNKIGHYNGQRGAKTPVYTL
jgi:dCTP deaminase